MRYVRFRKQCQATDRSRRTAATALDRRKAAVQVLEEFGETKEKERLSVGTKVLLENHSAPQEGKTKRGTIQAVYSTDKIKRVNPSICSIVTAH